MDNLKQIKITNLGQHVETKIKIGNKMTIILASNGCGKTTFTQAIVNSKEYNIKNLLTKETKITLISNEGKKHLIPKNIHTDQKKLFIPNFLAFSDLEISKELINHTKGNPLTPIYKDKIILNELEEIMEREKEINLLEDKIISGQQIPKKYRANITEKKIDHIKKEFEKINNKIIKNDKSIKLNNEVEIILNFIFEIIENKFSLLNMKNTTKNSSIKTTKIINLEQIKNIFKTNKLTKINNWIESWFSLKQIEIKFHSLIDKFNKTKKQFELSTKKNYKKIFGKWKNTEIKKVYQKLLEDFNKKKKPQKILIAKINQELSQNPLGSKIKIDDDFNITKEDKLVIISTGELKLILLIKFLLEIKKNQIVILDDVFNSLDFDNIEFILKIIKKITQSKKCQFLILTHLDIVFWTTIDSLKKYYNKKKKEDKEKEFNDNYKFMNWTLKNEEVQNHDFKYEYFMKGRINYLTKIVKNKKLDLELRLHCCRKILEFIAWASKGYSNLKDILIDSAQNPQIKVFGKKWQLKFNIYPLLNVASHYNIIHSDVITPKKEEKEEALKELINVFQQMDIMK